MKVKTIKREKGFTLVELMVVLAIIGILMALGTFAVRNVRGLSSGDTTVNEIFGAFVSARARAMGTSRIILVEVTSTTVSLYEENNPGSYDPISIGQAIATGSLNLADFSLIERLDFTAKSIDLKQVYIVNGGSIAPLSVPVYMAMLPNGKVMINNVDPIFIQSVRFEFYFAEPPYTTYTILVFPYTGRVMQR